MLTKPQIWLLKSAQRDAQISDSDYRDAIATVAGLPDCRSSKDPRLTNEHMDTLMSYFEAIYWRLVDSGESYSMRRPSGVFSERNLWASRNTKSNNTRDRYTQHSLQSQIQNLETALRQLGCGPGYFIAIQRNTGPGRPYLAALTRTLNAKQKATAHPF